MSLPIEFLNSIRWQDYLDIVILTLIIYRILLMVRGTRTIQILAGFILVAVFSYFADMLKLIGVTWVVNNIFSSIVVVLIVLFQSEIKTVLAQMGTKTLFVETSLGKSPDILDSIYSVCEHLAKTRTGALVVLENEMGLGDYYIGSTRINADFSRQLLVSIFNTHAPLHDGAVIISRDKKIAYAGCILPLSKEIDFDKKFGTRHRAALGLSEETDAVILVVSEERGEVSMAYKGELHKASSTYLLNEKIKEIFKKSE